MSAVALSEGTSSLRPPMLAMRGVSKTFGRVARPERRGSHAGKRRGPRSARRERRWQVDPDEGPVRHRPAGRGRDRDRHAGRRQCRKSLVTPCRSASGSSARNSASFRNSTSLRTSFWGRRRGLDIVPRGRHREKAVEILKSLAPHLRVDTPVAKLGMADRQLVEISRTLARGGRIIAFDEPTSSLTPQERDGLFKVIRGLRDSGQGDHLHIPPHGRDPRRSPIVSPSCATAGSSRPTRWRDTPTPSSTR